MRTAWISGIILAGLAIAAPARADEWSKKYTLTGKPDIRVTTNDGDVDVLSGTQKEIDAHVTTAGWKIPNDIQINESQQGDRVQLDIRVPRYHWNWFGSSHRSLRIQVRVPPEANLEVQSGDGNVTSQAVSGTIRIDTGDGHIDAHGLAGDVRLHSGDGQIEGTDLDGSLNADTGDGQIRVRGRFDTLLLKSGDGSIEAEAAPGSKILNGWTLHTGDGRINLRVPENFSADLDARTGDGRITLDFPVTVSGSLSNSAIHGKMNGGGGQLTLTAGDGSIRVEKL